jgi:hypothetical protein
MAAAALAGGAGCKAQADDGAAHPIVPDASSPAAGKLRIVPAQEGSVDSIVRGALDGARAEGRTLVVYVGATWCEPCQYFHRAAQRGDLDATFPRMTLLEFDLDKDRERLVAAGYTSKYIPLFALPGPDGTASGKQVEGGIKGDGAVGYISGRLQNMLSE